MKRILAFAILNFKSFKGFENSLYIKFMRDVFFEVKFENDHYSLFLKNITIDRYKTKGPILLVKSRNEDDILEKWESILLNEKLFGRILKENLDKFKVKGNLR